MGREQWDFSLKDTNWSHYINNLQVTCAESKRVSEWSHSVVSDS